MRRQPCFRLPVTPDDLVRHALAAYYRAVADATAPIAYPTPVDWSSPEHFVDTLLDFLQLRVRCGSAAAGFEVQADHERYATWCESTPSRDRHTRDVDPGLWAQMCINDSGHLLPGAGAEPLRSAAKDGCASAPGAVPPASAVGPATAHPQTHDITHPDNPLFCARTRQELPEVNRPDNLDSNGELIA
jgi:hypothetical protein